MEEASDNIYLSEILNTIRVGIANVPRDPKEKEDTQTQRLVENFNKHLCNKNTTFLVGRGHVYKDKPHSEDIYFYLSDDNSTPIFFMEAKRLPKHSEKNESDYVIGKHSNGSPSGGIERYKLGLHGEVVHGECGMLGYIDHHEEFFWMENINAIITGHNDYGKDEVLERVGDHEFRSRHRRPNLQDTFRMHHFWIDRQKPTQSTSYPKGT